jgi:hypothetical protein
MAVGQSGGVGLNTHPAIGLQGIQVGLGPGVVAQHLPGLGQGCPPSSTGAGRVADVPQQVQRGYLLGQGVSTSCVSWDHITSQEAGDQTHIGHQLSVDLLGHAASCGWAAERALRSGLHVLLPAACAARPGWLLA